MRTRRGSPGSSIPWHLPRVSWGSEPPRGFSLEQAPGCSWLTQGLFRAEMSCPVPSRPVPAPAQPKPAQLHETLLRHGRCFPEVHPHLFGVEIFPRPEQAKPGQALIPLRTPRCDPAPCLAEHPSHPGKEPGGLRGAGEGVCSRELGCLDRRERGALRRSHSSLPKMAK